MKYNFTLKVTKNNAKADGNDCDEITAYFHDDAVEGKYINMMFLQFLGNMAHSTEFISDDNTIADHGSADVKIVGKKARAHITSTFKDGGILTVIVGNSLENPYITFDAQTTDIAFEPVPLSRFIKLERVVDHAYIGDIDTTDEIKATVTDKDGKLIPNETVKFRVLADEDLKEDIVFSNGSLSVENKTDSSGQAFAKLECYSKEKVTGTFVYAKCSKSAEERIWIDYRPRATEKNWTDVDIQSVTIGDTSSIAGLVYANGLNAIPITLKLLLKDESGWPDPIGWSGFNLSSCSALGLLPGQMTVLLRLLAQAR